MHECYAKRLSESVYEVNQILQRHPCVPPYNINETPVVREPPRRRERESIEKHKQHLTLETDYTESGLAHTANSFSMLFIGDFFQV